MAFIFNNQSIQTLQPVLTVLLILGYLPPWNSSYWSTAPGGKLRYRLYRIYGVFIMQTLFCILFFLPLLIFSLTNLEAFLDNINIVIEQFAGVVKGVFVLYNRHAIKRLLNTLNSKYFATSTEEEEKILFSYIKILKGLIRLMYGMAIVATALYLLEPLARGIRRLPFDAWYPVSSQYSSPTYEILYLYQFLGLYVVVPISLTVDLAMISCLTLTCAQFDILSNRLSHFYETAKSKKSVQNVVNSKNAEASLNDLVYIELVHHIRHHQALLGFLDDFKAAFDFSLFTQYGACGMVLSVTTYQASNIKSLSDPYLYKAIIFLQVAIVQLFIFSWYGTKLFYKSTEVTTGIIYSNWTECNTKVRQAIYLITCRSNNPITITAGNLIVVGLESFLSSVQMAYSLFTLLKERTSQ